MEHAVPHAVPPGDRLQLASMRPSISQTVEDLTASPSDGDSHGLRHSSLDMEGEEQAGPSMDVIQIG